MMLTTKEAPVEINGAVHRNFLRTKKRTATVRAGIAPYTEMFHQSIGVPPEMLDLIFSLSYPDLPFNHE